MDAKNKKMLVLTTIVSLQEGVIRRLEHEATKHDVGFLKEKADFLKTQLDFKKLRADLVALRDKELDEQRDTPLKKNRRK